MVIIDEHDVGKSREEVLLYLVYEATGQVIPLDKIVFGKPQEVDPRKDLDLDPNTFIPAQVVVEYDERYWIQGSGFLYRRRNIINHIEPVDLSKVQPQALPFKMTDLLDQINAILPYPIKADDMIDYEYKTLDEVKAGVRLQAHPESLLWISGASFLVDTTVLEGGPLIKLPHIDGFHEWGNAVVLA